MALILVIASVMVFLSSSGNSCLNFLQSDDSVVCSSSASIHNTMWFFLISSRICEFAFNVTFAAILIPLSILLLLSVTKHFTILLLHKPPFISLTDMETQNVCFGN